MWKSLGAIFRRNIEGTPENVTKHCGNTLRRTKIRVHTRGNYLPQNLELICEESPALTCQLVRRWLPHIFPRCSFVFIRFSWYLSTTTRYQDILAEWNVPARVSRLTRPEQTQSQRPFPSSLWRAQHAFLQGLAPHFPGAFGV